MFKEIYNCIAYYKRNIITSDHEQERTSLEKIAFNCYEETPHYKQQFNIAERIETARIDLVLATNNKIAESFRTDGEIEYNNDNYAIVSITKKRSFERPNAYIYFINMKIGG